VVEDLFRKTVIDPLEAKRRAKADAVEKFLEKAPAEEDSLRKKRSHSYYDAWNEAKTA